MIDIQKLKALAEAATPGPWSADNSHQVGSINAADRHIGMASMYARRPHDITQNLANQDFIAAANPAAVLDLIAETETLESYLCACPDCGGQGEIFSGSYSYFGHMDPPEPNMDKCGSCDGEGFIGTPQELHTVLAERDQLKAENESLRKDAERYRWLRAETGLGPNIQVSEWVGPHEYRLHGEELDIAIDGALSKEAQS